MKFLIRIERGRTGGMMEAHTEKAWTPSCRLDPRITMALCLALATALLVRIINDPSGPRIDGVEDIINIFFFLCFMAIAIANAVVATFIAQGRLLMKEYEYFVKNPLPKKTSTTTSAPCHQQ